VDDALEVQRVVQRRAGRVQLDEAVQRGLGLGLLVGLVVGIGTFQLGLLRQRRAGRAAFQLLVQGDRAVVGAAVGFGLGLGVDLVGTPAGGLVLLGRGTAGQQDRGQDG